MEEKNVKTGFWSEYFKSLGNHPLRTIIVTVVAVEGVASIFDYVFGRNRE